MRHAAVLFDLFGTLIEVDVSRLSAVEIGGRTLRTTFPRWATLLADYVPGAEELSVAEFFYAAPSGADDPTVERPSRLRFRAALARVGCRPEHLEEASVVLSRAHMAGIADATVLPPANRAVLDCARSFARVAIVSNFDDTAGGYALLARHGLLEHVDAVVVSEAVGRRKPHPLPVRAALRSLSCAPEEAIMIGDSIRADVGAAHAAGVAAVWIDRQGEGVGAAVPGGTVVVHRLADVPRTLAW